MELSAELLDLGVLLLLVISLVIGWVRGLIKESISLLTWVAALGFAFLYVRPLSQHLPFTLNSEVAHLGLAFALIFIGVLVVGAFVNFLLVAAVRAIGLKSVDHILGAVFGLLRAALIISLGIILVELTTLQSQPWWQNSRLIPLFEGSAEWLTEMMPEDMSNYLNDGNVIPPEQQGELPLSE